MYKIHYFVMKRYNMHFYSMEEKNLQQFGTEHRYIYIYYNKIKWKKNFVTLTSMRALKKKENLRDIHLGTMMVELNSLCMAETMKLLQRSSPSKLLGKPELTLVQRRSIFKNMALRNASPPGVKQI